MSRKSINKSVLLEDIKDMILRIMFEVREKYNNDRTVEDYISSSYIQEVMEVLNEEMDNID